MYPVYNQFMDSYPSHHHMNQMHPMPYQSWQPHPGYGFPGFSYYPGYFAPPPMFYGGYPAPPMPYRAMQMPFYGPGNISESNGQYCCSCPNHQLDHKMKDGNNVKIEDDSGKIPWGFVENGAEEKEKKSHGAEKETERRSELSEEEKGFLNRLIPLFMEGSGSRNQGSDSSGKEEREKDQNQDADKGQFPFPLIWMPYNLNDKSMEKEEKEESNKNNGSRTPERNNVPKVVPVKTLQESTDERTKSSSMKNVNGGKENGKPSSPLGSSRLPPVCLRVDPVHKKKNGSGSGSSRSPSPPRDKNEPSSKDTEQHERKVITIEVSEGLSKKDEARDQNLVKSQVSEGMTKKEEAKDQNLVKSQVVAADGEANEPKAAEKSADGRNVSFSDNIGGSEKVNVRRTLSEGEAATMIQSAYRGYEVRRWESLKKLKQISGVRDEVVKLVCEISSDAVNDGKRRIAIDESIMNLLLKLDTIQGLHPSIRDVRKSVARELVSLQEKIDHLSRKGPEIAPYQESGEDLDPGNQEREGGSSHPDQESGKKLNPGNQESGEEHDSGNQDREGARSHPDQESGKELDPGNQELGEELDLGNQEKERHCDQESGEEFDPQNLEREGARSHPDQESGEELDPGKQEREGLCDQESVAELDPRNQESGEELDPRNQEEEGVKSHPDQESGKELDPENQELGEELDLGNQEKERHCDQESGEELDPGKQEKEESGEEVDIGYQERDEQSMTQESQESKIVMENGAAKGKDPTEKPQEVADDGESLTGELVMEYDLKGKNLTEEPQEALADVESWKGETVMEDETREKILTEQPPEVPDEDVQNSKETLDLDSKSSSNAGVLALGSHEIPTEAPEVKEGYLSPPSTTSFLGNKKLIEENEKMREMMQKLIEAGNHQISTISELSGRVEDLEKKLRQKNRLKMRGKNRKACKKSMNA